MYYSFVTKEIHSAFKKNGLIASLIPSSNLQANNYIGCIPGWLIPKDVFFLYTYSLYYIKIYQFFEAFKILEAIIIPPLDRYKAVKIGSYRQEVHAVNNIKYHIIYIHK